MKKETEVQNSKKDIMEAARASLEKQFGKGAIMKLGESPSVDVKVIPSGCILLDEALGVGGYPQGRIIEIYGHESSGKTTLALQAIAECQKKGGITAFIDAEHALDPSYAKKLGVDVNELWISQPDNGEQALELAESLVKTNAVDLIVIDSVAALTPQAEIEGEMGEQHVGLQARLMSQALRKLTGILAKSSTTIIFINQIRMKIGVMFGSPETTTGGTALKFYSSVRIEVRKGEAIMRGGDEAIGNRVKVKIVKNKVAPPFRKFEADLYYGVGLSRESALLDCALRFNIIEKSGSWFSYNGEKIGQGRDNVVAYLTSHPEFVAELEGIVRSLIFDENSRVREQD